MVLQCEMRGFGQKIMHTEDPHNKKEIYLNLMTQ